jgi:hypothetical protein
MEYDEADEIEKEENLSKQTGYHEPSSMNFPTSTV